MMDQPFWASRVAALGAACAPIPARQLTASRLSAALTEVTSVPSYRVRSRELGELVRGEDGHARVVERIAALEGRTTTHAPEPLYRQESPLISYSEFRYQAGDRSPILIWTCQTGHRERSADDLDPAAEAGRTGQPFVAGDKDCVQQFCKRDVRGVVRRQVLSQFPTACDQLLMWDPLQRECREIRHGEVGPSHFQLPDHDLSSPDRCDLQIDQFRRGQSVAVKAQAGCIAIRGVVGEGGGQDTGVNDDHDPPGGSRSPS